MTDTELKAVRDMFPITRKCVYLDNASTGPLPGPAVAAIEKFLKHSSEHGEVPYPECEAVVEATRAQMAQLMRVQPGEVAFTRNTSSGIILAIGSIPWQKGDNLVMMKDAFPADRYPFHFLLPEVEKRYVTSQELALGTDCVLRLIDRHTRAVALDWVHSPTGVRADIAAISEFCRALGVFVIVDAIQGLGVVDMDFSTVGADFVCSSTNKWLMSPQGTGIICVKADTLLKLKPYNLGWLSARWEEFNDLLAPRELKTDASRYEEGTKNYLGIYGLHESLKILLSVGQPAVEQHVRQLTDRLRTGLRALNYEIVTPEEPKRNAGIVLCRKPETDMVERHRYLRRNKIVCAVRQNCLRIAPHFYNTLDEVGRFLKVLGT
jgi:selenocysteine lyase/cysteine desulfurase